MAAPPGFDPNASVLPDPGASSAPIHVMRGGGMKGGAKEDLLRAYKLAEGQELASKFSEEDKLKFVAAINSGGCNLTTKSVLDANCAPVVNVLKALLNQKIKTVNARIIPEDVDIGESQGSRVETMSRSFPNLFRRPTQFPSGRASIPILSPSSNPPSSNPPSTTSEEVVDQPILIVNENDAPGSSAGISGSRVEGTNMNNNAEYNFPPINNNVEESPLNIVNQNVLKHTMVNSPKTNYRGNKSRRSANVRLNLTRKNKRIFSNFNINSKPVRIYGNSPQNIAARYNYELTKSRKNAQKLAENKERTRRNAQLQKQKLSWEKQAQKETVKSIKGRLNEQISALRAEKKSLPQAKKFYEFWKGGKKTRKSNRK